MGEQPTTAILLDQPGWGTLDLPRLGRIVLAWSETGLVLLEQRGRDLDGERLRRWLPELAPEAAPGPVPARYAHVLRDYDRGAPVDPACLPVDLRGTAFQNRVWAALRRVPRGRVRTYGGLAMDAGVPRALRAVGMALAMNPLPIVVPCHRVIAEGSKLGGYGAGLARKRELLALEGVRVRGDRVLAGQLELLR